MLHQFFYNGVNFQLRMHHYQVNSALGLFSEFLVISKKYVFQINRGWLLQRSKEYIFFSKMTHHVCLFSPIKCQMSALIIYSNTRCAVPYVGLQ